MEKKFEDYFSLQSGFWLRIHMRRARASRTKFMSDDLVILCDISSFLISRRATAMLLIRASIYPKGFRSNTLQT